MDKLVSISIIRKFLLGALGILLYLSSSFSQESEINYTQILKNSREVLDIGGAPNLRQDCINLLKVEDLNWEARGHVHLAYFNSSKSSVQPSEEILESWLSMEKYNLHNECYGLNRYFYSFHLLNKQVEIKPYSLFYFREIDFFKSKCDSLKIKYDIVYSREADPLILAS